MLSVDVRIRHDDDTTITEVFFRLLTVLAADVDADVDADGADEAGDLVVLQQVLRPGLLDVKRLAAQRQDGLEGALAALDGASGGTVALDQKQLALVALAGGAVVQL